MDVPDWQSLRAGTRDRVALWLHSEIGEGGTFRKAQLRAAFPNVEQVDRRMRDLRPEGWVIATYREDRSLESDELRLVKEGGPVWERGYQTRQTSALSDAQRREVLAADNYRCLYCGVGAGEAYPDDAVRTARLSLSRTEDGTSYATACDRCRAGEGAVSPDVVRVAAAALSPDERDEFDSWVAKGARSWSDLDIAWAKYRALSSVERKAFADSL